MENAERGFSIFHHIIFTVCIHSRLMIRDSCLLTPVFKVLKKTTLELDFSLAL